MSERARSQSADDSIAPLGEGARRGYHHGDLRHALIAAGISLAREGGPQAVVLREAARRTGVSATAAYRHFADHAALLEAVKHQAIAMLDSALAARVSTVAVTGDPARRASDRLRLLFLGYIDFALAEPGLLRLAFDRPDLERPPYTGDWGVGAYRLLAGVVDELVAAGVIDPARRPYTEIGLWAAAHGFAMLLVAGPLAGMPEPEREAAIHRLLDILLGGL